MLAARFPHLVICDQIARCSFLASHFILNLHTLFKIYFIKEKSVSDNIARAILVSHF